MRILLRSTILKVWILESGSMLTQEPQLRGQVSKDGRGPVAEGLSLLRFTTPKP